MTEMIVREYMPEKSEEDAVLLLPAFLAIWNEPENLRFLSFTQQPFHENMFRIWFSNHLSQGIHYYAVEKDKTISGIAVLRINQVEGFEIYGIGVRPESKKQGVGTKLLDHVLSVAEDHGFRAVEAMVFADNVAMLRLLLSLSFVPISMDYNRRCDGADMLRMKRVL